ncbi:MAG: hypothetical protein V4487_07375 [Chlamydiota bacterium]
MVSKHLGISSSNERLHTNMHVELPSRRSEQFSSGLNGCALCARSGKRLKTGAIMKKIILAALGFAFAFAISSCNEQETHQKCKDTEKCAVKVERHHQKW